MIDIKNTISLSVDFGTEGYNKILSDKEELKIALSKLLGEEVSEVKVTIKKADISQP